MPKVSPQYKESRRQEILEAARGVFAEQGFSGTSMADLVHASGLSMGALYRYFPSKTDLVLAMVEGRDGTVNGTYDGDEPPSDLLSRLLTYVAPNDSGVPHARLTAQLWGDAAVNAELAAKVRERHSALRDQLPRSLRVARESPAPPTGQPANVDSGQPGESALAEVLLAALIGYAALIATESPVDADAFEHALLSLLRNTECRQAVSRQ